MNKEQAEVLCQRWLPPWTGDRPKELIECYADEAFYRDPARPDGTKGRVELLAYLRKLLSRNPDWVWEAEEVCPLYLGKAHRLHWGLPAPAAVKDDVAARIEAFCRTRDELRRRLELLFATSF